MTFDPVAMGKRLENLSVLRRMSLRQIGVDAGVGIATMSKIANGLVPLVSVAVVVRICVALSVRLEWLVFGDGPRDVKQPPPRA